MRRRDTSTWIVLATLAFGLAGCDADTSDPDGGRPPTMDGASCAVGQTSCDGACVDTQSDPDHCGACGASCSPDEVCDSGACRLPMECPAGEMDCGAGCTDVSSDPDHCGGCGMACGAGEGCDDGSCTSVCAEGERGCEVAGSVVCVDPDTDPDHCGGCDAPCALGQACSGGTCGCPSGTEACGDACVDTDTNPDHCGGCGDPCGDGELCAEGACVCAGDLTSCGGECVNTDVDDRHCGACGDPCATPAETCVGGTCVSACGDGTVECGGTCVSLTTSDDHCGACDAACRTDTACMAGVCTPVNDDRADAIALTFPASGEITRTGTTTAASRDGGAADCEANGPNVWYSFEVTERQPVWVDTAGSGYDTAVFLTDASGAPLRGWCNDDCGCGTASDFTSSLQSCDWGVLDPGTYYVSVGGFAATSSGDFTLHVQRLAPAGRLFESPLSGSNEYTGRERIMGTSSTDGTCYTPDGSGPEHQYWFVACGDTRDYSFSTCPADDDAFFVDPHWDLEHMGRLFDPVLYLRGAGTGAELACNDDNVGVDCFDTDDRENLGARLHEVDASRGLNGVILDSRTGGEGLRYRMRYDVPALDVSTRRPSP